MSVLSGLGIRAVIILVCCVAAFAWHVYDRGRAYNEGVTAERLAWEERRVRDLAKAAADRKAAEDKIAQIEKEYLAKQVNTSIAIAGLEAALAEEKANDQNHPACKCIPLVPKRVRDELEKLGR